MQNEVDRAAVVLDVHEVPDRRTVFVEGQREVVDCVGDEDRHQLLGVLVGAVVVGAASDEQREVEALRVGLGDVLATGLARGVWAARPKSVGLDGTTLCDVAIHLICADEQEDLVTVLARRLAQHCGAAHVGVDEGERVHQRAVDVRLGREVDDRIHLAGQRVDQPCIADVAVDEAIALLGFELEEVAEVACVRELVEDDDLDVGPGPPEMADEVGADESRGPSHEESPERPAHLIGGPAVQSYPIVGSSWGMRPSSSGA